ncbi:MAG TPA: hypothetical protein VGN46_18850 [Luteibacter sp.]|uniref:hypothetical protein n=1 Tax=Luteibacter sp. TaxID=1886636 RepID=UPI002F3E6D8D
MTRPLILAACLTAAFAMPSAHAVTFTLDLNLASVHTERWARETLNQRNEGLGITAQLDPSWSLSAGFYVNSYRRTSAYALAAWTPLRIPLGTWGIAAGAEAGLVTGYRRNEAASQPLMGAGLVRVVTPRGWSLDLSAVPNTPNRHSGFVGAQLSLPL